MIVPPRLLRIGIRPGDFLRAVSYMAPGADGKFR